jgi:hypothetical protein
MPISDVPVITALSPEDRKVLEKLKEKAYFRLIRLYGFLFLALGYIYFKMFPGQIYRGHVLEYDHMTLADYQHVYYIVAAFFSSIFLFFLIRDYRKMVIPLSSEMSNGKKYCSEFYARKYADPIYKKCLLFYPGKEDLYIEISPEDFASIGNGECLRLESACITGEILFLGCGNRTCKGASEFSFDDEVILLKANDE